MGGPLCIFGEGYSFGGWDGLGDFAGFGSWFCSLLSVELGLLMVDGVADCAKPAAQQAARSKDSKAIRELMRPILSSPRYSVKTGLIAGRGPDLVTTESP
jgi:hypothetical protein